MITFFASALSAQQPILPPDNDDLESIISSTHSARALAERCASGDCVAVPCSTARTLNDELLEARYYALYNWYWLRVAADRHGAQYASQAESIVRDEARRGRLQTIVAYQEYVTKVSAAMFKVAGVLGTLRSIAGNRERLGEMSNFEILAMLDDTYEGLKSLETAASLVSEAQSDTEIRLFRMDDDELNRHKSQASAARRVIAEAIRNGRNWRATASSEAVWTNLGQIAGSVLVAYAEEEIAERRRLAESLANEVSQGENTLTNLYEEWIRFRIRRDLAEDAHRGLEHLFNNTETSWNSCIGRLSINCGSFRITPRTTVPEAAEVTFQGSDLDLATHDPALAFGNALIQLNGRIADIADGLRDTEVREIQPGINASSANLGPGESFDVSYEAPACFPIDSRIGIYPVSGSRAEAENAIAFQLLNRSESGSKRFKAPDDPGLYYLTMYDTGSRREVALMVLRVREPAAGNKSAGESASTGKSAAHPLSGLWELRLVGSPAKIQPILIEVDGSSGRWGVARMQAGEDSEEASSVSSWVVAEVGPRSLLTTWSGSCVFVTGKIWDERHDIPTRIELSEDGNRITIRSRIKKCEDERLKLDPGWEIVYEGVRLVPEARVSPNGLPRASRP
ncbi:MAG TPA: hypothetical protein VMM38_14775 [Aridibacter sp.]|nr:hypothetical protein [Aridibacter sp.]